MAKKEEEFTGWLQERQVMLIKAARGICFDIQTAEDVLQDALVDIYKRWEKIKNHENLEAYVIRVIISKHADLRRKVRRREKDQEFSAEFLDGYSFIGDGENEMADALMVQKAMKELSPAQRAVLMLHYEYGFALREIATILEIPAGTAASHLARGKSAVAAYVKVLPDVVSEDKKKIASREVREITNWSDGEVNS